MISLKNYQETAVTKLTDVTLNALSVDNILVKCPQVLFHAPTGAGKTIMMGQYMQRIIDSNIYTKPVSFVWISIGKGDLVTQSQLSVQKNTSIPTYNADDIINGTITTLKPNTCLFISWDKMNMKDKQNQWINKVMNDGDNGSLPRVIYNTSLTDTEVIIIIDESHTSSNTLRSQEILKLISPKVIVNVTATPKDVSDLYAYIQIDPTDVIGEGMIKASLEINNKIKGTSASDVVQVLLDAALNKQEQLIKYYQVVKSDIIPLCLIQLPDGKQSQVLTTEIKEYLASKWNITEENGLLAETFTGVKTNFDGIEDLRSKQRVLLFKTAIDTGWDCPRAQILVKFRDMKSECFKKQIVGRILRMPEQKHYGIKALNKGYIYTDEEAFSVDDESVLDKIELQNVPVSIRSEYETYSDIVMMPSFTLPKELRLSLDYDKFFPSFGTFFTSNWDRYYNHYKNDVDGVFTSIMKEQSIDMLDLLNDDTLLSTDSSKFQMSTPMIKSKILKALTKAMRNSVDASTVLEYLASFKPQGVKAKEYYSVVYSSLNDICAICSELVQNNTVYPYVDPSQILNIWVNIPKLIMSSEAKLNNSTDTKCILESYVTSAKSLINTIINTCEEDSNSLFWYPNYSIDKEFKVRVPLFTDSFHYISPDVISFTKDNKLVYHFTHNDSNVQDLNNSLVRYLGGLNLPNLQWTITTPFGTLAYDSLVTGDENQQVGQQTNMQGNELQGLNAIAFGIGGLSNIVQQSIQNNTTYTPQTQPNIDSVNTQFTDTGFTNTGFNSL